MCDEMCRGQDFENIIFENEEISIAKFSFHIWTANGSGYTLVFFVSKSNHFKWVKNAMFHMFQGVPGFWELETSSQVLTILLLFNE